jgi:TRAP-type C4-dicarboxylate transport system permease small subunit
MPGTLIASVMNVLRRITALLAMVALIGLLVLLIWQVELHHQRGSAIDEPAVVTLFCVAA